MTMPLTTLLPALEARKITFAVEGDRLKIDAPAGALTPELRAAIAEHKPELLRTERVESPTEGVRWLVHHRIPLDDLSDYLARNNLRVVGGTARPDGKAFRPLLFLTENAAEDAAADAVEDTAEDAAADAG